MCLYLEVNKKTMPVEPINFPRVDFVKDLLKSPDLLFN